MGRLLWQKVYVGSAIGLSKYKNGGIRLCDITTLLPYLVPNRHQGTAFVVRKKVNYVIAPTGGQVTPVFAAPCIDLQTRDS